MNFLSWKFSKITEVRDCKPQSPTNANCYSMGLFDRATKITTIL